MKLVALLAVILAACAPIPPLQSGPYWFKSGAPSALPPQVHYSYKPPVDCPQSVTSAVGLACGAAVRDGKAVFLIWVDSSQPKATQNCILSHELAHMRGWHHAQWHPHNSADYCGLGLE